MAMTDISLSLPVGNEGNETLSGELATEKTLSCVDQNVITTPPTAPPAAVLSSDPLGALGLSQAPTDTTSQETVEEESPVTEARDNNIDNVINDLRKKSRRVYFPEDTKIVSGYMDPPSPWNASTSCSTEELISAYLSSCERLGIRHYPSLLHQLQAISNFCARNETLTLRGVRLDYKHCETLEEVLRRVQFRLFDLEGTHLDDEGAGALFDMIEYYESCTKLNISHNRYIGVRGWQACARMMKRTPCLEKLEARSCLITDQAMPFLCRSLRLGSMLTVLHLENSIMSGRPLVILVTALKMNEILQELYLADNRLMPSDGIQLGNLLRYNFHMQLLDIRNNHLQDVGTSHISDGLWEQNLGQGLNTLVLWNNQVTYQSMATLSRALMNTKNLETINLGHNNITNEGIHRLKDGMLTNKSLLRIGLQAAKVSCEGAVALAEFIAESPRLMRIDLRENEIKTAGLMALSLALKVSRSVTRVDLDKIPKRESAMKDYIEQQTRLLTDIGNYMQRNRDLLRLHEEQEMQLQEQLLEQQQLAEEQQLGQELEQQLNEELDQQQEMAAKQMKELLAAAIEDGDGEDEEGTVEVPDQLEGDDLVIVLEPEEPEIQTESDALVMSDVDLEETVAVKPESDNTILLEEDEDSSLLDVADIKLAMDDQSECAVGEDSLRVTRPQQLNLVSLTSRTSALESPAFLPKTSTNLTASLPHVIFEDREDEETAAAEDVPHEFPPSPMVSAEGRPFLATVTAAGSKVSPQSPLTEDAQSVRSLHPGMCVPTQVGTEASSPIKKSKFIISRVAEKPATNVDPVHSESSTEESCIVRNLHEAFECEDSISRDQDDGSDSCEINEEQANNSYSPDSGISLDTDSVSVTSHGMKPGSNDDLEPTSNIPSTICDPRLNIDGEEDSAKVHTAAVHGPKGVQSDDVDLTSSSAKKSVAEDGNSNGHDQTPTQNETKITSHVPLGGGDGDGKVTCKDTADAKANGVKLEIMDVLDNLDSVDLTALDLDDIQNSNSELGEDGLSSPDDFERELDAMLANIQGSSLATSQ